MICLLYDYLSEIRSSHFGSDNFYKLDCCHGSNLGRYILNLKKNYEDKNYPPECLKKVIHDTGSN